MNRNLTNAVKTIRLKVDGTNYTGAAGTTDLTSEVVDTQGYEGARFLCGFGAIVSGAVTSVKAQQGLASDMADAADLEGSAQTIADTDDNKVVIVDIRRPRERYVRHFVDRGTQNATIDFLIVELYGAHKEPVTRDATILGQELHASPAEGTA